MSNFIEIMNTMDGLFKSHNHSIRAVGGAVRDHLLGVPASDIDFATTATPDQMMAMVKDQDFWHIIPTGVDHGTVTFVSEIGSFEVTTLRKDVETDGRHAVVEFTDDWKEDAARRDFTINAMSMDASGNVYDYFNGQQHLDAKMVVFVGDANERIKEDALRIIRYFRFKARFGASMVAEDAIKDNIDLIKKVSPERIWQEIVKASKNYDTFVSFLKDMISHNVFETYAPDIEMHVGYSIKDIKPEMFVKYPTFGIGASCLFSTESKKFAETFKLSSKETAEIEYFNQHKYDFGHSFDDIEDEIVNGVNPDWVAAICQFNRRPEADEHCYAFKAPKFPVSGDDVINVLRIKPGKEVGDTLRLMKQHWKASRYSLSREVLLNSMEAVMVMAARIP